MMVHSINRRERGRGFLCLVSCLSISYPPTSSMTNDGHVCSLEDSRQTDRGILCNDLEDMPPHVS